jgi:hypothetical protein
VRDVLWYTNIGNANGARRFGHGVDCLHDTRRRGKGSVVRLGGGALAGSLVCAGDGAKGDYTVIVSLVLLRTVLLRHCSAFHLLMV